MNLIFTVSLIGILLSFSIFYSESFAEENKTIEIEVKYTNGDVADFNSMKAIVYQDFQKTPFLEKKMVGNPDVIDVPENHRYKIEIYVNGIYADVGYIQLNEKHEKIQINIPISSGLKFIIYHNDGETPLEGATVVIKSHDNTEWARSQTNSNGETIRHWIQSTVKPNDHYIADVYIGETLLSSESPIHLQPGLAIDQKIITPIPKIIEDLITVSLYKNGSNKILRIDGSYEIDLINKHTETTYNSKVNYRGDAHFANLEPGIYEVIIKSENGIENELWHNVELEILGDISNFNIFKIHSIEQTSETKDIPIDLETCNCVAFRFDDIQDYWLSDTQVSIIELFAGKEIPLTIGIVGSLFGDDEKLKSSIIKNMETGKLEIANHSWDNEPVINFDYKNQEKLILDTQNKISDTLNVQPKVFIPPQNLYDENTIDVLKNNGFTHISSHLEETNEIRVKDNFIKVPAVVETGILKNSTHWEIVETDFIKNQIEKSVLQNGYAIVMMHPQEFSLDKDGNYGEPNQEYINELGVLLNELSSSSVNIVQLSETYPLPEEYRIVEEAVIESCNCVAFRLDDIQDFWLNDVQIEIMDVFGNKYHPLTVGIIADAFGNDPKILEYITSKNHLEIATKGTELIPFTNFNKEEQNQKLSQSIDKIENDLGIRPTIFIPPNNMFNSDTIEILNENKITHFSSSLTNGENPPFGLKDQSVYRFPQISTTGEYDSELNLFVGRDSEQILNEVDQGLQDFGFAVITMHPQEFSIINEGIYENTINNNQLQELEQVLKQLKEKEIDIVSIGNINLDSSVQVPSWIKNNAGWWADGSIDDETFVQGIEYLVQEGVIEVSEKSTTVTSENVPSWIKNNAGWWADGSIDDETFVQGIEYLVKMGIISY